MLLMFLGESSLLVGVGIVSTCLKVLNDFKTNVFELNPHIVITPILFPAYLVLVLASMGSSMVFEYSCDFQSTFCYFVKLLIVIT